MKMIVALTILCFCNLSLFAAPLEKIPDHLYDQFTCGRRIPVLHWFLDNSYSSNQPNFYSKADIDERIARVLKNETAYYGVTDHWLYAILNRYPIRGKEVAIIGSALPWYESIVIAYGGYPTTIEYNSIITDDPRLKILTPDEFNKNPKKFDVILSISSTEHDGLGRYGDPIDPDGDLKFMKMAKKELLKESGHMILAVPVGKDALVWNAHRIYGRIRLPLLIEEWEVIDTVGFNDSDLSNKALGDHGDQPVFYLAPKKQ